MVSDNITLSFCPPKSLRFGGYFICVNYSFCFTLIFCFYISFLLPLSYYLQSITLFQNLTYLKVNTTKKNNRTLAFLSQLLEFIHTCNIIICSTL